LADALDPQYGSWDHPLLSMRIGPTFDTGVIFIQDAGLIESRIQPADSADLKDMVSAAVAFRGWPPGL
jgi:hypothetical protein